MLVTQLTRSEKSPPLEHRPDALRGEERRPAPPPASGGPLAMSRRLDWRFLLREPDLKDVAFVGEDGELQDALRLLSQSLTVFTPAMLSECAGTSHARSFDLVVATDPSPRVLAGAYHLLKPGGYLYAEVFGGTAAAAARLLTFRRSHSANRLLTVLRRHGGFDRVRAHWHWPDFESTTYICPLADLTAAAQRAASNGAGLRARILAAASGWARGRRMFASLATHVSLVARRSHDHVSTGARRGEKSQTDPGEEDGLTRFLLENRQRLGLDRLGIPERLAPTLVTPRFRASAHVIVLLCEAGQGAPVLVAKRPRLPQADESLAREAHCLQTLHARRPGGLDTAPRVITYEVIDGWPLLIETAIRGRHLNARAVRRDPGKSCRAVVDWLAAIDQPAATAQADAADRFSRLIDEPLLRLEEYVGTSAADRRLLEQARLICDRLRQFSLPAVFEHGDLCDPNLLLCDDGRIAVVDWELADPAGLPAVDLVFFLAFAASARARARTSAARMRAFDHAFFHRNSWTAPYVRAYLDRHAIPVKAFPALFVLGWTRYLAKRLPRSTAETMNGHPSAADLLRENRYFAFWRHAVGAADRLPADLTHLAGH